MSQINLSQNLTIWGAVVARQLVLTMICIFCIASLSHSQHNQLSKNLSPLSEYRPPVITDPDRIERIKQVLPLIDKMYKDHAASNNFPAIVYGIVVDGKLIHTGGAGNTDVANQIPANSASVFRIASMTKSFTAMAVIKLRDEGKIQLDDPAYKYVPQLKKLKYLTRDASPVTVRHLLTHSAGFPEDNPWGDRQLEDTDADLIELIESGVQFSNVPGTNYEYSNLGFALLGRIIANVSGKPYQQYITDNILKPLGMMNTYWEFSKVLPARLAHGYRWINNNWREEALLHDGSHGAMGGLLTSIEDYAKYMALHFSAWPARNDTDNVVLKRSSLREMHQPWRFAGLNTQYAFATGRKCPTTASYAYGLRWTKDCQDRTTIGHSGGLPGFGSNWTMIPEYGIGVVCFANLTYAPTSYLNQQVLDTLIALAKLNTWKLPPSNILMQRRDELVKLLPKWGNLGRPLIFAENFFPDYPIDSLRKEATAIYESAGKIIRIGEVVPENNLRGSFIIEAEKSNISVVFTLTPENPPLIQEYHISEMKK